MDSEANISPPGNCGGENPTTLQATDGRGYTLVMTNGKMGVGAAVRPPKASVSVIEINCQLPETQRGFIPPHANFRSISRLFLVWLHSVRYDRRISDCVRHQLMLVAVHVAERATCLENAFHIDVHNASTLRQVSKRLLRLFIKGRSIQPHSIVTIEAVKVRPLVAIYPSCANLHQLSAVPLWVSHQFAKFHRRLWRRGGDQKHYAGKPCDRRAQDVHAGHYGSKLTLTGVERSRFAAEKP